MIPTIIAIYLFAVGYGIFRRFNMGLARNSRGQQLRRYLIAAVQVVIPMLLMRQSSFSLPAVCALLTATLWIVTYNVLYDKTNRQTSPDYDNHMDIAFGIYIFGWLSALQGITAALSPAAAGIVTGLAEAAILIIPLAHIGYYSVYRTCIDDAGMIPMLDTYASETVEYVRSLGIVKVVVVVAGFIGLTAALVAANWQTASPADTTWWLYAITAAVFAYFSVYIWKPRHGLFVRTGVVNLYIDVRDYFRGSRRYRTGMEQRLSDLSVTRNAEGGKPHTVLLVIGESACRDYMSAFEPDQPWETTPWETAMSRDRRHFSFFRNAYSCAMQTVPALERALTERSQYNNREFSDSVSVIDIARKAGYRTSWFSNQGHIGKNDTSATLVASTADRAEWTLSSVEAQYDSSLIDFLDTIDPTVDNFVVLHLIGSHFNYENRYPESYAKANGLRTDLGDVECYRNSIRFTDSVLQKAFEKASQRLNLEAMVYCSDHGGIPDMRRSPRFLGFKMVRIPLWTYLSDSYIDRHPAVAKALADNRDRYFTNDLLYDLMCGIFDIRSNRYDPSQSLASADYCYQRADMLTYDNRIRVADDDLDKA